MRQDNNNIRDLIFDFVLSLAKLEITHGYRPKSGHLLYDTVVSDCDSADLMDNLWNKYV